MEANPCPTCGRDRGQGRAVLGVDAEGTPTLGRSKPVEFCEPCTIGIDPESEWPRERRAEFRDAPRSACGWATMPDGTLVAPGDQF